MRFIGVTTAAVIGLTSAAMAAPFDGASMATPGISAFQILNDGLGFSDGLYWIDPDGLGGNDAFQAYADMTTDGGGWTLGLASFTGDPSASTDMVSNTGVVGFNSGHTRNLTNLAIDGPTQIRHQIIAGGTVLFDGYYTGSYHGTLGGPDDWTTIAGNLADVFGFGLSNTNLGREWTTVSDDNDIYPGNCAVLNEGQPWYYSNCVYNGPYWFGTDGGGPHNSFNLGLPAEYRIFVRGEAYGFVPGAQGVPASGAALLLMFGLAGIGLRRRAV